MQIMKPESYMPVGAESTVTVIFLPSKPAGGHRLYLAPVAVPYNSKLAALGKGHIVVSISGYYLEN